MWKKALPRSTGLVLAASVFLVSGATLGHELIPVSEASIDAVAEVGTDYASALSRRELTGDEAVALGSNAIRECERYMRGRDAQAMFDHRVSHFIAAGRDWRTDRERVEHLRVCPVCRSLTKALLRDTAVPIVALDLNFSRVLLVSPEGESTAFGLDRFGELHLIDARTGIQDRRPVGQLVFEAGRWFATDGFHWEGPIAPAYEGWPPGEPLGQP